MAHLSYSSVCRILHSSVQKANLEPLKLTLLRVQKACQKSNLRKLIYSIAKSSEWPFHSAETNVTDVPMPLHLQPLLTLAPNVRHNCLCFQVLALVSATRQAIGAVFVRFVQQKGKAFEQVQAVSFVQDFANRIIALGGILRLNKKGA